MHLSVCVCVCGSSSSSAAVFYQYAPGVETVAHCVAIKRLKRCASCVIQMGVESVDAHTRHGTLNAVVRCAARADRNAWKSYDVLSSLSGHGSIVCMYVCVIY